VTPDGVVVLPGVDLGEGAELQPFVYLGVPPYGVAAGELRTHLGPGAILRSHTVIYAGNMIGARFQTGHGVMVRELNTIGDDVSVGTGSVIEHHVTIGNRVRMHSRVFVPECCVLEDDAWLGPNVVLTNARYPRSPGVKETLAGVTVRQGAKLGANCTVLPGLEIGAEALVGAGSVVTNSVPPGAVVAGNPARVINDLARLPYR
jgi:acetyltransferase-like isoleucine patch superfamily enzyme